MNMQVVDGVDGLTPDMLRQRPRKRYSGWTGSPEYLDRLGERGVLDAAEEVFDLCDAALDQDMSADEFLRRLNNLSRGSK